MLKKAGLFFLALVFVASMVGGGIFAYDKSQQLTPEEEKAKIISYIKLEDLVEKLGPEGLRQLWSALPDQTKKEWILSQLEKDDLTGLLGPTELLAILSKSGGQHEKDSLIADLVNLDYLEMTKGTRAVELQVMVDGRMFVSQSQPSWLYNKDGQHYVIVSPTIFIVPVSLGFLGTIRLDLSEPGNIRTLTELLGRKNALIQLSLLPDSAQGDPEQKEKLGGVKFINRDVLGVAIVERAEPILGEKDFQYAVARHQDLEIGQKLYRVRSHNGYQRISREIVAEMHEDEEGRRLIDFQEPSDFEDIGGLFFAIDKQTGRIKVAAILSVIEKGGGWIYAVDINQVIKYIESETSK